MREEKLATKAHSGGLTMKKPRKISKRRGEILIFIKKSLKTSLRSWVYLDLTQAHRPFQPLMAWSFDDACPRRFTRAWSVSRPQNFFISTRSSTMTGDVDDSATFTVNDFTRTEEWEEVNIHSKLCNDDTWKKFIYLPSSFHEIYYAQLLFLIQSRRRRCCCSTLYINMKCYAFSLFYALFPLYYNFSVNSLRLFSMYVIRVAFLFRFFGFTRNHFPLDRESWKRCICAAWHDDFMGQS